MIIIGASGHGKVIFDCALASGIQVTAFADKDPAKVGELLGVPVVLENDIAPEDHAVVGIGDNRTRKMIADKLSNPFTKVVHPSALVSNSVQVSEGTVILHGSIVQIDTRIDRHVIINTAASIDHDCVIEDFVHIAPNVTLCGGVRVGEGTLLGAGSVVLPSIKIGNWCVIGAGAVVNIDLPDYCVAVGNPVRIVKVNSLDG